tara:strand:- start:12510 stop:12953 length:444 start_codon:yes stop_codon:yes gene_type:complete
MKYVNLLFLMLTLCLTNSKASVDQVFGNFQNNQNVSGDTIPSEFIDLLYLKLLTHPYDQSNIQPEYTYQHKIILTKTNKSDIDKFSVYWIEMISGNNYSNSIPWQSNFQDQILYLLNDNWFINEIIPHISNDSFDQKIYIFKRINRK